MKANINLSPAGLDDAPQLVDLINSGYRGEASKKGWTTEADLLEGDARIDTPTLELMMNSPGAILLKAVTEEGSIDGCVYLRKDERGLYLGLLTVNPDVQSAGIGKLLLQASEDFAKLHHCPSIYMQVISRRKDLIAWYERRGYQVTNETRPFPADNKFGIPTLPLEFVILEKAIAG